MSSFLHNEAVYQCRNMKTSRTKKFRRETFSCVKFSYFDTVSRRYSIVSISASMLDSVFSAVFYRHMMHAAITSSLCKLVLLLLLLLLTESSPSASYKAEITRRLVV